MGKPIVPCLICAVLLLSCASHDKVDIITFQTAPLFGMIYDEDNQPCAGANVTIDDGARVVTDIRGRFLINDLSRGSHTLFMKKDGFEELTVTFQFLNKTDVLYLKAVSFAELLLKAERALEDRKWDEADAYLSRAEKLNPGDTVFLYLRAVEAYKTEKFEDAVKYLNTILDKGAKDPYVFLFLADIYEKNLNDTQKAIENLEAYLSERADSDTEKRLEALKAGVDQQPAGQQPAP
jgi:tetratricopeptide (TPR) repeat protein